MEPIVVGAARLYHADCRDVLRSLPDNSIDSVVTDPPYALVSIVKRFGKPGSAPATGDVYNRSARGFMGKQWDNGEVAFAVEFWAEVLRVLKPGGHVVAFSGTRTYHRMAVAIEDAGFEIRDQLGWLYGSGFPKSHDVSKGIAKRRVEDVEPIRVVCRFIRAVMDESGLKSKDLTHHFGDCNARLIDHWAARDTDSQPALPTWEQWDGLVDVLHLAERDDFEYVAKEVARLNARKGTHGERWLGADVVGEITVASPGFGEHRFNGDRSVRSLDEEASQWQGWGTALKPSWEPICLARKPLIGTVAENVLEYGTGALNIDGCRVGSKGGTRFPRAVEKSRTDSVGGYLNAKAGEPIDAGRWPANIVHDGSEEVVAGFPHTTSGTFSGKRNQPKTKNAFGAFEMRDEKGHVGDSGSAARFFYCAKASRRDRDEGLEHLEVRETAAMHGNMTTGQPLAGNGTPIATPKRANTHPTVKPTALMQWLCRLVTPPGGTILDPFLGSGSTGKAALLEGFNFIGCEREDEYMPIAEARIRFAVDQREWPAVATQRPAAIPDAANDNKSGQADLFAA